MAMSITLTVLPFLYLAVPTLLLSILQLFICRKEPKWGRILPIFSIVVSVFASLVMVILALNAADRGGFILLIGALAVLAAFNIPTLIFYLIYRTAKKKQAAADVERMKIDDLE